MQTDSDDLKNNNQLSFQTAKYNLNSFLEKTIKPLASSAAEA